jgi:hypothetical protein
MHPFSNLHWKRAFLRLLAGVLLVLTGTLATPAQTFRGGIAGTVLDTSGAAIPDAAIIAVETGTNATYNTVSTKSGEFDFANLPVAATPSPSPPPASPPRSTTR